MSNGNIFLKSSTFQRYGKWADSREDRIKWLDTILGNKLNLIKNSNDSKNVLKWLTENGFDQLKFGSYTRNSPIVKTLKKWYSTPLTLKRRKRRKRKSKKKLLSVSRYDDRYFHFMKSFYMIHSPSTRSYNTYFFTI